MSADVSSPYEAAIAAKRVASLMAKYNVDMDDVIRHELESEDALIEITFEKKTAKRMEIWIQSLSINISRALNCKVAYTYEPKLDIKNGRISRVKKLTFQGFEPDCIVANWLLGYTYEQITRMAKETCTGKGRSFSSSFKRGAAAEVCLKIAEVYKDEGTVNERANLSSNKQSLVLIKQDMIAKKYGEISYSTCNSYCSDEGGYYAGKAAGASVAIHKAMNGSASKKMICSS